MQKPCNKCEFSGTYPISNNRIDHYCAKYFSNQAKRNQCEKYAKYDEYLESRRQYCQGEPIKSIEEYLALKASGESLFYFRDSIRHYKVIESLQFRVFVSFLNHGYICKAIKKQ